MTAPKPYLRSFGRRKARKLRPAKAKLQQEAFGKYVFALAEGETVDPATLLPQKKEYRLEIGFGDGGHLAYQAKGNPEIGFIGAEPFLNGVASLVEMAEAGALANIRIFHDDVRLLLACLKKGSIDRVDILFPDPWPKTRHKKRRLVQTELIGMLANIIKPGGVLRMASDDTDYIAWMLQHMMQEPRFTWTAETPEDWKRAPQDWIETKYQKKAVREGRYSTFLEFMRESRPSAFAKASSDTSPG